MGDHTLLIGIFAGVFSLLSYPFYIVAIVKGKTKPHLFTWGALAILQSTSLFFYVSGGAEDTVYVLWGDLIGIALLAIFSFYKEKEWKFERVDWVCLFGALAAGIVYIIFHQAFWSLIVSLFGELLALTPTLRKAYRKPWEEDYLAWLLINIANILSLFAIRHEIEVVYLVTIFTVDFLIFFPILWWRFRERSIWK